MFQKNSRSDWGENRESLAEAGDASVWDSWGAAECQAPSCVTAGGGVGCKQRHSVLSMKSDPCPSEIGCYSDVVVLDPPRSHKCYWGKGCYNAFTMDTERSAFIKRLTRDIYGVSVHLYK